MSKKCSVAALLLLTLSINQLFAQGFTRIPLHNTYQDAQQLAAIFQQFKSSPRPAYDSTLRTQFINILVAYNPAFSAYKGGRDGKCGLNSFFDGYLPFYIPPVALMAGKRNVNVKEQATPPLFVTSTSTNGSVVQGLDWEAAIVNGVATFMANRFKQEAVQTAMVQIFRKMTTQDSVVIRALFPKTFAEVLRLSKVQVYYSTDLVYLQQLVQQDIDQLPNRLVTESGAIFNIDSVKTDFITVGYDLYRYNKEGFSLPDIITQLDVNGQLKSPRVKAVINYLDVLSCAAKVGNNYSGSPWVNPGDLLPSGIDDLNSKPELRFFYGLLYEQFRNTRLADSTINGVPRQMAFINKFSGLLQVFAQFNSLYQQLANKDFKVNDLDNLFGYVNSMNQALNTYLINPDIISALNIDKAEVQYTQKILNVLPPLLKKDYNRSIPMLVSEFGADIRGNNTYTRSVIFISQLASVSTADQVQSLMEAYALPIGGSSIKRQSTFNISINSYVGFTGGIETAYGTKINQKKGNLGLAAPIGISTTVNNGRITFFASVFDLGTMINQRLHNDTTSYAGLKLQNFFAPGLGIYYNLLQLPLSFGIHYNYIPNLRTITYQNGTATITDTSRDVSRLNVSVLFDIPFFTIANKPKVK